jgi:hypothetical protein
MANLFQRASAILRAQLEGVLPKPIELGTERKIAREPREMTQNCVSPFGVFRVFGGQERFEPQT